MDRTADNMERVTLGINALRNTYGQDWYKSIDLTTLDQGDGTLCVLAQCEKAAGRQADYFHGMTVTMGLTHAESKARGFIDDHVRYYTGLTAEWKRRIANLQEWDGGAHTPPVSTVEDDGLGPLWLDVQVFQNGQAEPVKFFNVGGLKFADGLLTFEKASGTIFSVPNVSYWSTEAADE